MAYYSCTVGVSDSRDPVDGTLAALGKHGGQRERGRERERERSNNGLRVGTTDPYALQKERKRSNQNIGNIPGTGTNFSHPRKPHNIWGANRPGGLTRPLCPAEEEER